jgi:kynurenine 3-monooxygenase
MGKIIVVGSGLVGSLLSIYLVRRGHQVEIYERRPDMRKNRISAGRSINLALSDRGWRGLEGVGIADEVKKVALPMSGRMIHSIEGQVGYQAYGKEGQAINSVSRGGLNCLLMDLAEKNGVTIHYNKRCTHVDLNAAAITVEDNDSKIQETFSADRIFNTDGAFSAGRLQMQLTTDRFNYSQYYLEHGYKELSIPPVNGEFAMDPKGLHIWPRGTYMLIALPNLDKTFTCTLFFPFEGENSFAALDTIDKARNFFKKIFGDALALMPDFDNEYQNNPVSSLVTVKCFPWRYKDKMLMLGDAAHAIVPFYGQGMNCGFEDCVVLDGLIEKHGSNWEQIFIEFERLRKPDGDAIADLAIGNFIEMRDKVGQAEFLLQKKIEAWFSGKHPNKWIPLYTMVTYSPHIRYSEALHEGQRQEKIMQQVMKMPGIESKWDSPETEQLILKLLV